MHLITERKILMSNVEILEAIQTIIRDVFDDEKIVVNENTHAGDIEDWDSLSNIRLTMAIEKHFAVKFGFKELQGMKNVGDMIEIIEGKLRNDMK